MHNDRTAKLRRRTVALQNLKKQQQKWKDVKSVADMWKLLSTKVQTRIADGNETVDDSVMEVVKKAKLTYIQGQVDKLEKLV